MRKKKRALIILAVFAAVVCTSAALVLFKVIKPNSLFIGNYPVRGVDVSHYQGEIDWDVLSSQGIDFVFIKATEGSSFVDPCCEANIENAVKTDLRVGVYHFFSFDSPADTQAENFIRTVGNLDGMLPPAVDVELYGNYWRLPGDRIGEIKTNLRKFVDILTDYYGKKPVIYTTRGIYGDIVDGVFSDCDLWIRNVYFKPSDSVKWTFWQYSDSAVLEGYDGTEKHIDMNVFCGTKEDFSAWADGKE